MIFNPRSYRPQRPPNNSTRELRSAALLLSQGSLGPRWAEILEAQDAGDRGSWVDSQLSKTLPRRFIDRVRYDTPFGLDTGQGDATTALQVFWTGITKAPALRGKCLKTLMRIFVMSERAGGPALGNTHQLANWLDRLDANVFGNYVDLLESVTYSPQMSMMLSHYANSKASGASQPDENYAREIMQLFTIGLWELNSDGTRKVDPQTGKNIPTYDNTDIQAMARVFTGLTRGDRSNSDYSSQTASLDTTFRSSWPGTDEVIRMINNPVYRLRHYAGFYDNGAKYALKGVINIPDGTDGPTSLRSVHVALVNHPSCAPFVCTRLIHGLVTSNPSPEYVTRVVSVFRNNGSGVVGDLKAVWKAILTDPEASREGVKFTNKGRMKDGLELAAHQLRYLDRVRTDGWNYLGSALDTYFGTELFRAPSIFGDYDLTVPNPETLNWTAPTTVTALNRLYEYVSNGEPRDNGIAYPASQYADLPPITSTPEELTERINLLFCGGTMSPDLRTDVINTMNSINATTDSQRYDRIWTALNLVTASVEFRSQL